MNKLQACIVQDKEITPAKNNFLARALFKYAVENIEQKIFRCLSYRRVTSDAMKKNGFSRQL